jgi:hypothetical protein
MGLPERLGRRTEVGLVIALAVVGLGLRLAGLSHGLPELLHDDTPKQIHRVPRFVAGDLVPPDAYPTLHMYLVALALRTLWLLDPHAYAAGLSVTQIAITARLLNALLGAATVVLVYALGRRLFGWPVAAVGAALLALSSLHVLHAHYEMGDVTQTFFVVAAVLAAARALQAPGVAVFALAGACAGLAASAKYYGIMALGAVLVAGLSTVRAGWRRAAGLVALAGAAALAAFVLTTPKLLLTPWEFLAALEDAFVTKPPPPLAQRPLIAAKTLVGIALEWVGWLHLGLALAGAGLMAARRLRGWLVLATPVLVVGLYATVRAHRLDDRNLVILTPFAGLLVAMAVVWLGRRSRPLALAAGGLLLAVLLVAGLDALHVAGLFRMEDTQRAAGRWLERLAPPDGRIVADTYRDSIEGYRTIDADLLHLDTREYLWDTAWYAPTRFPEVSRALAFLEAHGKLLQRFELMPRAFTSPTWSYYELDSMEAPYALPPPQGIAPDLDSLVFLDPDVVPQHLGGLVPRQRTTRFTLVSRAPLRDIWLALSGAGRVRVRHGLRAVAVALDPARIELVRLDPRRGFPWFTYLYPLTVTARDGHAHVRVLATACDRARVLLLARRFSEALPPLDACRRARWEEPGRLLDLAWAHAELGQPAAAKAALEALDRAAPGLAAALDDLAGREDGPAWREAYRRLAGRGKAFWWGQDAVLEAEATPARVGAIVSRPGAGGGQVVRVDETTAAPAHFKIWFPQHFLRGRYVVRFRLRGQAAGPGPLATLDVVRHFQDRVHDTIAARPWSSAVLSADFTDVALHVATEIEPVKFEPRVLYHGRGVLEIDAISIAPDARGVLAAKLERLRSLVPAGAPGALAGRP